MEGTFGKFISSPLFTFIIGPEKKEFTVHSKPLADISSTLNALMNGEMMEAKVRRVEWPDVDEDTFVRLCEYAYLQDYSTPPRPLPRSVQSFEEWGERQPGMSKKERKKYYKKYLQGLGQTDEPVAEPVPEEAPVEAEPVPEPEEEPLEPIADAGPRELPYREASIWTGHLQDKFTQFALPPIPVKTESNPLSNLYYDDFKAVFEGHVRLYVLADKYGIQPLCFIVLHKLYETLKQFKIDSESVTAVMEFVRCVYSDTLKHAKEGPALRDLATRYMVSVLGQIGDELQFSQLLEEGGDFVADFWRMLWKPGN
ncbi:hypothetical protein ASPZODRAFT_133856 [Penicilliopsis zonata CBS 506.65]|uniref:Uncharacterized protein n=1 Tax=Penicilliopsis zonata CBS 506.65 TaxID=1073090 RepID=A0A1L9SDR9_9EURO|nr:hypothetical protein ASPZODRAFT_133856 [Penicilliopsis zonata CBS 506.65]OJJ45227.1 hypothetical protein ASPZODRAFT_133856 [Penicilliopsis zonata CBS 506.65]